MTSLRIAIVIDDFFPSSGGIGRSVQTQLEELTALGHDVTLIVPDIKLEKPRIGHLIETPTHYLKGLPAHLSVLRFGDRRAERIAKKREFDIVHTQTERGAMLLGAKIAKLRGVPHVHTFHANIAGTHQTVRAAVFGTWLYRYMALPLLRRVAKGRMAMPKLPSMRDETGGIFARMDWQTFAALAGQVDAFSVPSPFMLDLMQKCSSAKLHGHVVPTGVNRQMLSALREQRRDRRECTTRFISVGRLAKEKRLDVLIRAFRRANLQDSELVLIGDGDQRNKLKRLAEDLPVDFRGHVPSVRRIAYELVNADALVLSSYRFDSQGLVIAEAVAAGLPVLYCDDRLTVGLSKESALLTGPDIKSIARGLQRLSKKSVRDRMSRATHDVLPGLMPEQTAIQFVDMYRDAIERKARG